MRKPASLIQVRHRSITILIVILIALAGVMPVLAEYLGPNRTRTESSGTCKIVLNECQYVPAKGDYRYHTVNSWSCSNESKPWQQYPSSEPRECTANTTGDKFWERDEGTTITVTYPQATIGGTLQNCTLNNGWCVTAPHLSLIGSEPVAGYSILAIEGTRNGQTFACSGSSCNVPLVEGANNLTFWAFSSFTDTSLMGTWSAKVDTQQPTITGTLTGTAGSNGWYTSPVTLNGAASDAASGSGLASFTCTLDGTPLSSCASIPVNGDGMHTLSLTARDQAGNVRTLTHNASIDSQNPVLAASISGTRGSNDWYTEAELNASASDPAPGSSLSVFEYNLDNSSWTPFPSTGTLTLPEGNHTIDLRAVDRAGLTATSSRSFLLDRVIPSIAIHASGTLGTENWYTTPLSISASAADETSGMAVFEYRFDNDVWTAYSGSLLLEDGIHALSFWAEDQAGLGTQEDRNYRVDSRPPQIAGSISGTPGENGWFITNVTLSASASDPIPGSGMDAFNYILNEDSETSYSEALNLSDGQHTVQLHARDKAGLTYSLEESVRVDTLLPSLQVGATLPAWVKDTVTLSGTASDEGSGLSSVDISLDGGSAWQALESADSWSYIWDTLNSSNGMQEILLRARDHAGLVFQQSLRTGVDNRPPSVNLPAAWFQWDTVTLDVWDDHSGLAEVLVEISDPENRWPSRVFQLDEAQFPLQFTWDRRFGDGTTAPAGTYDLKLTATDQLGHSTIGTASIRILLTILPPGPTSTPQPPARPTATPTATFIPTASPTVISTQTSVVWIFGTTAEPNPLTTPTPGTIPTLRVTPTQNNVEEWFESVFGSVSGASESTTEIGTLDETVPNATPQESGVLWGAAAAAMMGAMTSYALDEKRKREEEQARRSLQEAEAQERRQKTRARKMEKIEEQRALELIWEQTRLDEEQDDQQRKQDKLLRDLARMDARLLRRGPEAEEAARWDASQDAISERYEKKLKDDEEQRKAQELQEGLAAYYNGRKQGEAETSQPNNYWEKTKSLVNEHFLSPFREKVYEPFIEPVLDLRKKLVEYRNQLVNEYIYQPIIKPAYEGLKQISSTVDTWIDKNVYQPYVGPILAKAGEKISQGVSWLNENVYQPHIKPALERTKQFVIDEAAWINKNIYQPLLQPVVESINKNIYQPFIKPAIDKRVEQLQNGISWVNENIYQPMFAPMFKDIHQYILKPLAKDAKEWWGEYGEWVHGALDLVGLIPGAGEIADGINGLIYLAEGRKLEATLSLISAIPVIGYLGAPGKAILRVGETIVDTGVGTVAKGLFGNALEKAAKESVTPVAETTAKKSLDWVEKTLDAVGCIPGVGSATTSLNGLIQLGKGRLLDATFSTVSLVPVVGDVVMAGKNIIESSLKRIMHKHAGEITGTVLEEVGESIFVGAKKRFQKEIRENAIIDVVKEQESHSGTDAKNLKLVDDLKAEFGDRVAAVLDVVPPQTAKTLLKNLDKNVLDYAIQQGPDAVEALSLWKEHELKDRGVELALRAKKDAQVIADIRKLIQLQPIDPKNLTPEQRSLIKSIADNSTQYPDAGQLVLGKWVDQGSGFVETAKDTGSVHYNPHSNMWDMLSALGDQREQVAWLVNQQVVQTAIEKSLPIEYSLNGVPPDIVNNERAAIRAVFSEKNDSEIMESLGSDYIPIRIKELQELNKAGYQFTFDEISNSFILIPS